MKTYGRKTALKKLAELKQRFRHLISGRYEVNAKDCFTCGQRGSCCLDRHFVNVQITRLEAEAIVEALEELDGEVREAVLRRNGAEMQELRAEGMTNDRPTTYSCPLFSVKEGCLVHRTAKPLPCIHHACYGKKEDLPPYGLLAEREKSVERLNTRAYGNAWNWLPIPVWIEMKTKKESADDR